MGIILNRLFARHCLVACALLVCVAARAPTSFPEYLEQMIKYHRVTVGLEIASRCGLLNEAERASYERDYAKASDVVVRLMAENFEREEALDSLEILQSASAAGSRQEFPRCGTEAAEWMETSKREIKELVAYADQYSKH
ncbi:MAG TPA: hypothetical protein VF589_11435 [Allosphingosinicella sp.]